MKGPGSVVASIAIAPLAVVTLLDALAFVLGEALPAIPLFAQMFLVLLGQTLPAFIILLNSVFFCGRQVAPPVVRCQRHGLGAQKQEQSEDRGYGVARFHRIDT